MPWLLAGWFPSVELDFPWSMRVRGGLYVKILIPYRLIRNVAELGEQIKEIGTGENAVPPAHADFIWRRLQGA